ncbi:MAG TPA: prepilin-type N-terminal cleavage/methylation domain-containing protein [Acetivibrio clariflavus]|nr:prepilin-type N-terminal cleavage/methylation domain-containing protein [Acetivibrio clariflavus]
MFCGKNSIRKNQKGFSIIELMVISMIFSILAAAMPYIINYLEEEKVDIDNLDAIEIENIILKNIKKGVISLDSGPESISELVEKELGSIPKPRQNGFGFYYFVETGNVKAMEIGSTGEGWIRLD